MSAFEGLPAPAKLNLFLQVTGRRDDGYHDLQTLFRLIDYGDRLDISLRDGGDIKVDCRRYYTGPEIAAASNLVLRAAALLRKTAAVTAGADIVLHKRVPPGSGLGGGSSDAATTLHALNRLWGCGMDDRHLCELGFSLGADVPVFIRGYSAWAEGAGERLTAVTLPDAWYLVLLPQVEIITARLFAALELELTQPAGTITIKDYYSGKATNVFEPLVRRQFPQVAQTLDWLDDYCNAENMSEPGCIGKAKLSGTGCSVFAEFATREQALDALAAMSGNVGGFVARGLNTSPLLQSIAALDTRAPASR